MFVSFSGTSPTNAVRATDFHIQLAHPLLPNTLVLMEHKEGGLPYSRQVTGWLKSADRTLTGSLKIMGNRSHLKTEWKADFLVTRSQYELFEELLTAQIASPITMLDRFNGEMDAVLVWLDVDAQWLTPHVMGKWWQIQFVVREE
jgi:hypothetical protein